MNPKPFSSLVVFHQGGIARHGDDPLRGIEYVATPELGPAHILASAAIPALFPAVRVTEPEQAAGWYFDGGPRLNTPIKPALWLGAERVIVIALNSVAASRTPPPEHQADFYVGAAHLLHAALGDPLAQDIRTLANRNALIAARVVAEDGHPGAGPAARHTQPGGLDEPVQPVPYIFIAPEDPSAIGEIARRVYCKHYRRPQLRAASTSRHVRPGGATGPRAGRARPASGSHPLRRAGRATYQQTGLLPDNVTGELSRPRPPRRSPTCSDACSSCARSSKQPAATAPASKPLPESVARCRHAFARSGSR